MWTSPLAIDGQSVVPSGKVKFRADSQHANPGCAIEAGHGVCLFLLFLHHLLTNSEPVLSFQTTTDTPLLLRSQGHDVCMRRVFI
jgi:hypothetical protein